ncbi:unnamed protein product [Cylicocyclus nassatus]|uniref:Purine nucleoside phosphorylase n=1 Tax=Cylicocyclus nassatus TaxID=53992 RepID=A0AA36H262_CYLNA|nr:unnamed protein product [Cylicocyclus nassatus]
MTTINNNIATDPAQETIDPRSYDDLLAVSSFIRSQLGDRAHAEVGIIYGSGLGPIAELIESPSVLPYEKIPGFHAAQVIGHKGNLLFGKMNGKDVVCMQGRFHPFEHHMDLALCSFPVRVMQQLGVKILLVTNAAGGINPNFKHGDLMLIKDHIFMPALCGFSPMVALNDPRFGARFVSMHDAYDKSLRNLAKQIAEKNNIHLFEGVYVMTGGPLYETPAEVCMFRHVGGDAFGMSTCHEVAVARQCGIKVIGLSLITNICNTDADTSLDVTHMEVLQTAEKAMDHTCNFIKELVGRFPSL